MGMDTSNTLSFNLAIKYIILHNLQTILSIDFIFLKIFVFILFFHLRNFQNTPNAISPPLQDTARALRRGCVKSYFENSEFPPKQKQSVSRKLS